MSAVSPKAASARPALPVPGAPALMLMKAHLPDGSCPDITDLSDQFPRQFRVRR